MDQKTHSQKFLQQRKFFMALPILVLPFMTLMFWALGGGKITNADAQNQQGFNMQLPGANLTDDKALNKLSYYEKADSDSLKLKQLMQNDFYYAQKVDTDTPVPFNDTSSVVSKYHNGILNTGNSSISHNSIYTDPNETKVYQKLAELDAAINKASTSKVNSDDNFPKTNPVNNKSINSGDIDRLEQMMQTMNEKDDADPEMQQLNNMLEKILDIQHPGRVEDKVKQNSEIKKDQLFTVEINNENAISLLANKETKSYGDSINLSSPTQTNTFYSIDDTEFSSEIQNSIQAVIHETQTLVNGSTVKLRLLNDVYINGVLIPKDNFIFGTAGLNGERLLININSIRYGNSIFPVELSVFDMDGINGIYIPGAITRDVTKQSADRSAQQIGFTTLNPSIEVQAANAGIEAAKTLFSKKVKLIKVTVKAGYQVLLWDEKQRSGN